MTIFLILTILIFFAANRVPRISNWSKRVIARPYNYYVLLGLLVIGFFAKLDYTDRWGCIFGGESIFGFRNILFSSVSILFVLASFVLSNRVLKISFMIIELVFWIFKLFYFKGGYMVSIAAAPDPFISFYDTTTLAFRLFIINGLVKNEMRKVYVLIAALAIMAIKVFAFPTQFSMLVGRDRPHARPIAGLPDSCPVNVGFDVIEEPLVIVYNRRSK